METEIERINRLIKGIRKDKEKSLEELFQLTKKSLYYVAYEYLTEKMYAEDVLSEAYLKVYEKSKQFDEKKNGRNWLYEIVKNTALDYNRWFKRRSQRELEYSTSRNEVIKGINEKQIAEIRNALKVLERREYEVVYLRIWHQRTLQDIAIELKTNVSKVYRIYNQALEKLREVMEIDKSNL